MLNKKTLSHIFNLLKWGKLLAKIAAIGTTVTGTVTALTSSSTAAGLAMGAAGATTFAATKNLNAAEGYEKTKHVAPNVPIRNHSASRAIMAASAQKKYGASDTSYKPAAAKAAGSGKGNDAVSATELFDWISESNALSKTDEAQQSAFEFDRAPVMVVTSEEEEELDENGKKMKKIRRVALNFVAPDEEKKGAPV